MPSEHICGEYGAPDRPNTALEATGHNVRFMAGVGLYRVARASAWAFGVSPSNVVHRRVSLHRNTPHMHFLSREDNAKWGRIIKEAGIKGD